MQEDEREEDVAQLVDRRAEPGDEVGTPLPEGVLQRAEGEVGNELEQQPEHEDAGEQGRELSQRGDDEVTEEFERTHITA